MKELKQVIAGNISSLRHDYGLTQIELAEKLNYSDKAVSKWERGESVPDISVLKDIAYLFGVTVDYLITDDHSKNARDIGKTGRMNHGFITGMCIVLVWLLATIAFVLIEITGVNTKLHWLSFVYAVPVSLIVWLIFNSLWFNVRKNFLIISFLMWSVLGAVYVSFFQFGHNIWLIFLLGAPGQAIIYMWSMLKLKSKD